MYLLLRRVIMGKRFKKKHKSVLSFQNIYFITNAKKQQQRKEPCCDTKSSGYT